MPRQFDEPKNFKGGWRSAIFIIFVEMAQRFAYYGISGNLIMYLTKVVGQPVATAAKNVNSWTGVATVALYIGAFFADSYLGRFKTTLVSSTIYLVGLILLTISTSTKIPHDTGTTLFFAALYVTAIGEGGHIPCVQTFAADQFDEDTPEQKRTKSSFFNWWFLGIALGANGAVVVLAYIEDNISWTLGFGIPTISVGLALLVFIIGSRTYRNEHPVGSPFTRIAQVLVAASRKHHIKHITDGHGLCYEDNEVASSDVHKLASTNQFRCLDKAMIIDDEDVSNKTRNPWRLCSLNQVEETKLIIRLMPVWICTFGYGIMVAQVHTFFIKQGSTMDRSIGPKFQIPPASLLVLPGVAIYTSVPMYDKIFVPAMRKLTNNPTGINTLQRIGIGLGLSFLTVVIAALVETKRIDAATKHGILDNPKAIVPMSVWWLAPQFLVNGLSDFFTFVGMQEMFYDQMPEGMRSMGSALTNGATGVGALMSTVVISAVEVASSRWGGETWLVNNLNRAHLDRFYWLLAGFCALNLVVYAFVVKWYVWKKREGDQQDELLIN